MASERQVKTVLSEEDYPLFRNALSKYKITESELLREIVHAWIFSNKLNLENDKNDKK